ncbi:MAG: hypothetical protein IT510_09460 [Sulfuritalea sp.]|jgi:hypothetical protein|nr:hypothetical protein [Sulfuritalea sp.]
MDLYFSSAVQVELDDAFACLDGEQPGLGYRFAADVDEAPGRIRMYPLAWHPLGRNLRRCRLKHFRYGGTDWARSESGIYAGNQP